MNRIPIKIFILLIPLFSAGGLLLVQLPFIPIENPETQNKQFPETSSSKQPFSIVALVFLVQTPFTKE